MSSIMKGIVDEGDVVQGPWKTTAASRNINAAELASEFLQSEYAPDDAEIENIDLEEIAENIIEFLFKHQKQLFDSMNIDDIDAVAKKIAHEALVQKDLLDETLDENLHKWFKEKWVRFGPDGKIRGPCARGDDSEGKPKCLPQKKAQNLGKKGRKYAASKKRREDPNPERSGKAINVATKKKTNEEYCPECGGDLYPESMINEKKDACYYKVKSRYKVWPSAYASGALVQCRKKGASNWGKGKSNESSVIKGIVDEASSPAQQAAIAVNMKKKNQKPKNETVDEACWDGYKQAGMKKKGNKTVPNCIPKESKIMKGIIREDDKPVVMYVNGKPFMKFKNIQAAHNEYFKIQNKVPDAEITFKPDNTGHMSSVVYVNGEALVKFGNHKDAVDAVEVMKKSHPKNTYTIKNELTEEPKAIPAKKKKIKNGTFEDYTGEFAAEKTPDVNPYGGLEDNKFRGMISEMPDTAGAVGTQPGGWRTYRPKSAGTTDENQQLDEELYETLSEKTIQEKTIQEIDRTEKFILHFMDRLGFNLVHTSVHGLRFRNALHFQQVNGPLKVTTDIVVLRNHEENTYSVRVEYAVRNDAFLLHRGIDDLDTFVKTIREFHEGKRDITEAPAQLDEQISRKEAERTRDFLIKFLDNLGFNLLGYMDYPPNVQDLHFAHVGKPVSLDIRIYSNTAENARLVYSIRDKRSMLRSPRALSTSVESFINIMREYHDYKIKDTNETTEQLDEVFNKEMAEVIRTRDFVTHFLDKLGFNLLQVVNHADGYQPDLYFQHVNKPIRLLVEVYRPYSHRLPIKFTYNAHERSVQNWITLEDFVKTIRNYVDQDSKKVDESTESLDEEKSKTEIESEVERKKESIIRFLDRLGFNFIHYKKEDNSTALDLHFQYVNKPIQLYVYVYYSFPSMEVLVRYRLYSRSKNEHFTSSIQEFTKKMREFVDHEIKDIHENTVTSKSSIMKGLLSVDQETNESRLVENYTPTNTENHIIYFLERRGFRLVHVVESIYNPTELYFSSNQYDERIVINTTHTGSVKVAISTLANGPLGGLRLISSHTYDPDRVIQYLQERYPDREKIAKSYIDVVSDFGYKLVDVEYPRFSSQDTQLSLINEALGYTLKMSFGDVTRVRLYIRDRHNRTVENTETVKNMVPAIIARADPRTNKLGESQVVESDDHAVERERTHLVKFLERYGFDLVGTDLHDESGSLIRNLRRTLAFRLYFSNIGNGDRLEVYMPNGNFSYGEFRNSSGHTITAFYSTNDLINHVKENYSPITKESSIMKGISKRR